MSPDTTDYQATTHPVCPYCLKILSDAEFYEELDNRWGGVELVECPSCEEKFELTWWTRFSSDPPLPKPTA